MFLIRWHCWPPSPLTHPTSHPSTAPRPLAFPPHEQVSLPALWPPPTPTTPALEPGIIATALQTALPAAVCPQSPLAACPPHSSQTSFSREDLMSVTTSKPHRAPPHTLDKVQIPPSRLFLRLAPAYLLSALPGPPGVQVSVPRVSSSWHLSEMLFSPLPPSLTSSKPLLQCHLLREASPDCSTQVRTPPSPDSVLCPHLLRFSSAFLSPWHCTLLSLLTAEYTSHLLEHMLPQGRRLPHALCPTPRTVLSMW